MVIHLKDSTNIISDAKSVWKVCKDLLEAEDVVDRDKEHFWVFHLDSRNKIKFLELVSLGILNSSIVHPREVFTRAVGERSAQVIIAHNHPSGDQNPSTDDIAVTKRLAKAGEILGIELLDHIVITQSSFTSFREKALM